MKHCNKCGCAIVPGVNGCTFLPDCYSCHGGPPSYPAPIVRAYPEYSADELDALEERCLHDCTD